MGSSSELENIAASGLCTVYNYASLLCLIVREYQTHNWLAAEQRHRVARDTVRGLMGLTVKYALDAASVRKKIAHFFIRIKMCITDPSYG